MRNRRVLAACAVAMVATVAAERSVAQSPEADVRAVVLEFVAAWKAGDADRLRGVVASDGTVVWTTGTGAEARVQSTTFEEVLRKRSAHAVYEIVDGPSIELVDDRMGLVDVSIRMDNGVYVDHYVLYRVGGGWRIATKTFVHVPAGAS